MANSRKLWSPLAAESAVNNRGFTLVELLVSLTVFLLIVSASAYVVKSAQRAVSRANQTNRAVLTLQSKMEEIRNLPFDEVKLLAGAVFADRQGKINISPAAAGLLAIKLSLKPANLSLTTYRSRL